MRKRFLTWITLVALALWILPASPILGAAAPDTGLEWTARRSGTTASLRGVAFGAGRLVAVGNGGAVVTSADGAAWAPADAGTEENLYGLAHGSAGFVAVGDNGTLLSSRDGTAWTLHLQDGLYDLLSDVTFAAGLYVAVGSSGTILTSPDGASWTRQGAGTEEALSAIAHGGTLFVAVGAGGTILTSPDGQQWTSQTSGISAYLSGIAYGNGRFIAVGENDTVLVSSDGATWAKQPPPAGALGLWRVTYGNGLFVGVGGSGAIVSTRDGASWVDHDLKRVMNFLYDVIYVGGQFVAVGEGGTIRTSLGDAITEQPSQPPPAVSQGCTPGVVTGPSVRKDAYGLSLTADGITRLDGGWEELCGTISLTKYVKLSGTLRVSPYSPNLQGEGAVYIQVSKPFPFSLEILRGPFEIDSEGKKIRPAGPQAFVFAGLPIFIDDVELTDRGMKVTTGTLGIPEDLLEMTYVDQASKEENTVKFKVPVERVEVADGLLGGKAELSQLRVGALKLKDVSIEFDAEEERLAFGGKVEVKPLTLEAEFGYAHWQLDHLRLGSSTKIPFGSGFYVNSIAGEVSGLAGGPLTVAGEANIGGGTPLPDDEWLIKGNELRVELEWRGSLLPASLTASGKLAIWKVQLAEGEIFMSAHEVRLSISVNLLDILITSGIIKVTDKEGLYGHVEGRLQVPRAVWFFGGMELGSLEGTVDSKGVRGAASRGIFRYGCRVEWNLEYDCGRNVALLSSVAYRPTLLAAVDGNAAAAPQQVVVPDGLRQVIVAMEWSGADTDFTLTAPDGVSYTPQNSPLTSTTANYIKPGAGRAFYIINAPKPGVWQFAFTGPGVTTATASVVRVTPAPSLTLAAPSADLTASGPVTIRWQTDAPAGSHVSLFYTPDADSFNGTRIAGGLDAGAGSYTWDPTALPDGAYYLYAAVDDGLSAPVYAHGGARVLVRNPKTPPAPQKLQARSVNGAAVLTWDPVAAPDLAGYYVYMLGAEPQRAFVENATHLTWPGLKPGQRYQFAVSAVSTLDLESPRSAPVTVGITPPRVPSVQVDWPAGPAVKAPTLKLQGTIGKEGAAHLYLNGERVAANLTGTFTHTVQLTPGENELRLVTTGANGDWTEQRRLYVLDAISPELIVNNLRSGSSEAVITGRVEPGAALTLNGHPVEVRADGSYTAVLPLLPGGNEIQLTARDRAGNEKTFKGTAPAACGTVFPDVPAGSPACAAIERLAARRVLSGYPDGSFQPDRGVTRAEFAKMLVATLNKAADPGGSLPFSDTAGHWSAAQGYLQTAVALQAIGGFPDGTFRPNDPVTRAQVVRIVAAAAGLSAQGTSTYTDVRSGDWFAGWVAAAERSGLIGPGSQIWAEERFAGDQPATRAEAAMVLANLLDRR